MFVVVTQSDVPLEVVVGAGVTIVAAGSLLIARLLWKGGDALAKIIRFVLPHFEPPTEAEIRRDPTADTTLPARMKAQEKRLADHLTTEEHTTKVLNDRLRRIEVGLGLEPGADL